MADVVSTSKDEAVQLTNAADLRHTVVASILR